MAADDWTDAFDCLRAPARRALLLSLHERDSRPFVVGDGMGNSTDDAALSVESLDGEFDPVRLHHVHLPKLADAGYVERDGDDRIVPGDSFEEIRPLLETLARNAESLPGIAGRGGGSPTVS